MDSLSVNLRHILTSTLANHLKHRVRSPDAPRSSHRIGRRVKRTILQTPAHRTVRRSSWLYVPLPRTQLLGSNTLAALARRRSLQGRIFARRKPHIPACRFQKRLNGGTRGSSPRISSPSIPKVVEDDAREQSLLVRAVITRECHRWCATGDELIPDVLVYSRWRRNARLRGNALQRRNAPQRDSTPQPRVATPPPTMKSKQGPPGK